jgi:aminoglycoside phosphotransferase (APT) family kinase protein
MTTLESRIEDYLRIRLPDATGISVSNLARIPGGASRETWSLDARWSENGKEVSEGLIIRRDPDASVLETDRDVEFRVVQAVYGHVPVPRTYWLETDGSHLDRPFFVMNRIDGCETNPTRVLMDPRFFANRARIAREFVDALVRIHKVDWKGLGLDFLGVPANEGACALAEVEKWEEIVDRDTLEPQPVLRGAFRWLRNHLPPPAQKVTLVHADYRTGNFLCTPEGEIKGILDWEMAHLGDPMEDIGWVCMRPWRWLGNELIGGLMERAEFYRMYEELGGFPIDEQAVRFYEVLGNIKLAAIFITGARSFLDGRTKNPMMAFLGRNVRRLELEVLDLMGV